VTQIDGSDPGAAQLWIERRDDARGVLLFLSGELDIATAPELEECLSELMPEARTRVLLDLSQLRFVDSAGISVLIRAKQDADANGRVLVLRRPTDRVHRAFALVGLVDWLAFED